MRKLTFRPTTSSARYPNSCSAAVLKDSTIPLASIDDDDAVDSGVDDRAPSSMAPPITCLRSLQCSDVPSHRQRVDHTLSVVSDGQNRQHHVQPAAVFGDTDGLAVIDRHARANLLEHACEFIPTVLGNQDAERRADRFLGRVAV